MTMGESLGAIVAALEGDEFLAKGSYKLKGDNLRGLQLLVAPDGPWRTRRLRLRSYVLREHIATGDWIAERVPGAQLVVDLLTKPIVVVASWMDFRRSIGLVEFKEGSGNEVGNTGKVEKLSGCLEGLMTLSKVLPSNGISQVARVASAVGLSTLVACLHHETQDLKRARCAGKASATFGPPPPSPGLEAPERKGEVEIRKVREKPTEDLSRKLRDDKPNLEPVPRMKALRMSLTEEVYKRAPTSGKDQWVRLGQGWWCKQHKDTRRPDPSQCAICRGVPGPWKIYPVLLAWCSRTLSPSIASGWVDAAPEEVPWRRRISGVSPMDWIHLLQGRWERWEPRWRSSTPRWFRVTKWTGMVPSKWDAAAWSNCWTSQAPSPSRVPLVQFEGASLEE